MQRNLRLGGFCPTRSKQQRCESRYNSLTRTFWAMRYARLISIKVEFCLRRLSWTESRCPQRQINGYYGFRRVTATGSVHSTDDSIVPVITCAEPTLIRLRTIAVARQSCSLPRAKDGGGRRTRTFEVIRRLIYSQLPLPLGTLPRSTASQPIRRNGGD
jgi:hypothetical protein